MAREMDLLGIKKVINPLEESGTLILRSEEQVYCLTHFHFLMYYDLRKLSHT